MDDKTRPGPEGSAGDSIDIVEGPVGSASLKNPAEVASSAADLDTLPSIDVDDAARSDDTKV